MRSWYLSDIVEAAEAIGHFIHDQDRESFIGDDLIRSAVLQKLCIIGEAAAHLSKALRERHPEIEWPGIVAFRNFAIHAYFSLNWEIVWETATSDVPDLKPAIAEILRHEYPDRGEKNPDRRVDS